MTFHDLPDHARLWVHTADRDLTAGEQEAVLEALAGFLDGWAAHGAALTAAGAILYDRVLVVGLDEQRAGATGCSIDKLVGFVRTQGEALGVDWFDRHQVLWRQPGRQPGRPRAPQSSGLCARRGGPRGDRGRRSPRTDGEGRPLREGGVGECFRQKLARRDVVLRGF